MKAHGNAFDDAVDVTVSGARALTIGVVAGALLCVASCAFFGWPLIFRPGQPALWILVAGIAVTTVAAWSCGRAMDRWLDAWTEAWCGRSRRSQPNRREAE